MRKVSIRQAWTNIKNEAIEKWHEITSSIGEKINEIKTNVTEGFQNIKETIIGKITEAMDNLRNMDWLSIGKGIVDGILNGLNGIFTKLKSWATDVWNSVTSAFDGGGKSSSKSSGRRSVSYSAASYRLPADTPSDFTIHPLPQLANGAVIPPNNQFAAILGDQRSGLNIEAPLSTIEQAVQNVWDRNGYGGEIHITVESILDGKVVARNTVKHINDMTTAAGKPVLLF